MGNKRAYQSWSAMKRRCYNPKDPNYPNYGGRGIRVCEEWISSFKDFVGFMGERPEGLTLERKNTNGNYEPDNCTWADRATQQRNQRRNHHITMRGLTMTLTEWANHAGLKPITVIQRFKAGKRGEELLAPLPVMLPVTRTYLESLKVSGGDGHGNSGLDNPKKTHCPSGHEYTPENTIMQTKLGDKFRCCRTCAKRNKERYLAKIGKLKFKKEASR